MRAWKKSVDFLTIYGTKVLLGMLYIKCFERTSIVGYLAMDNRMQSKGCGSQLNYLG